MISKIAASMMPFLPRKPGCAIRRR
jgi:hypothetical protein